MFDPEELCSTCTKRSICSSLCPEAEVYANQDAVEQRDLTIGLPIYGPKWPEPAEKSVYTTQETRVIRALASGKSREEAAEALGISRKHLREVLRNVRRKCAKEE